MNRATQRAAAIAAAAMAMPAKMSTK